MVGWGQGSQIGGALSDSPTTQITYTLLAGGEGPELGAVVSQLSKPGRCTHNTVFLFFFWKLVAQALLGMWEAAMSRLDPPYT